MEETYCINVGPYFDSDFGFLGPLVGGLELAVIEAVSNEQLIEAARAGDRAARDEIVSKNLGLVWSVVRRFSNRGYDSEDLFQIGVIGLIKCVDKFDLGFNVKFSTYAVPMIMGEIRRFLRDDGMVKVSRTLKEMNQKARRAHEELSQLSGRPPTLDELAAAIDTDTGELIIAMESANEVASLYQTDNSPDGGEHYLIDRLDADEGSSERLTESIALRDVISRLPDRERLIIYLRYYRDRTQAQVAEEVGVSQVQVSRIERKVLKLLREELWS